MGKISIIKKIINEFNRNKVNYCILRNFDKFDDKDIDILIDRKDLKKSAIVLKENGFIFNKRHSLNKQKLFLRYVDKDFFVFDIKVDDLAYMDMPYLKGKCILDRKIKKNYFFIPSEEDLFKILLLHSIIDKGKFKPKYIFVLNSLMKKRINIRKDNLIDEEILSLALNKRYKKLEKLRNRLIAKLLFNPINLYSLLKVIYKAKILKFLRIINPFSYASLIVFIGTDGSGKSTLAKNACRIFSKNGFNTKYVYMGWNKHILPAGFFSKMLHKSLRDGRKKDNKKKKEKIYQKLLYFIADLFVLLEMYLRYFFIILPNRKFGNIVFSDRYAYDRILYKHSSNFAKWLLFNLFPKPSKIFYLYNDAEKLYRRKREIPVKEIKRQLAIFDNIDKRLNFVRIKTENKEKDLEKVFDSVFRRYLQ